MDSPFLQAVADDLVRRGHRVVRFEFPYMARRRAEGVRPGPDRLPVLQDAFRRVVAEVGGPVVVGGKSMGGRVATTIADEVGAVGCVVLGYPFHPPGRPEKLRTEHLEGLATPTLIVQGERDPFGTRAEVEALALSPSIRVAFAPDGDHDLSPRKASGRTASQNLVEALDAVDRFLRDLSGRRSRRGRRTRGAGPSRRPSRCRRRPR